MGETYLARNSPFGLGIGSIMKASMRFETVVPADQETVFTYVSDLTKHGEWAGNALEITAVDSDAALGVGKVYSSKATVRDLVFNAQLSVSDYAPSDRFAFNGADSTGSFVHTFNFKPVNGGTEVTRIADFELSFYLWIRFWVLYLPVRKPAGDRAMENLRIYFS